MPELVASLNTYAVYALVVPLLWALLGAGRWARERLALRLADEVNPDGAAEPPSLHPVIDPALCNGCGACAHACPEGRIIGLIGGKAQLIDPRACIGHGACRAACPTGAIELVLGTARRGVDIPLVSATFETSVNGLFVAGELGGMGLIANAIDQGRQAVEAIAQRERSSDPDVHDLVIVGAGPAGIAASLAARQRKLRFLTLEQETLGGTVAHYPRGKLTMTRPVELPLYGKVRLRRARKERLLELWASVIDRTGIAIYDRVRVEAVVPGTKGFEVRTSSGRIAARSVLLATGRRGAPRRLGVPGEDLAKVVYRLDDPDQYRGLNVLVVGGGDTAAETAVALVSISARSVTLCHRSAALTRPDPANRGAVAEAVVSGRIAVLAGAEVRRIERDRVLVEQRGERVALANDAVIVCAGGLLPSELLAGAGVAVETRYGRA